MVKYFFISAIGIIILFAVWFNSSDNAYYEKRDDGIYYNAVRVQNIDESSAVIIDKLLLRDNYHVFYKGREVTFLDPLTVHGLELYSDGAGKVYADRHGIYEAGMFGRLVATGSYDAKTFEMVGVYFKDKNYLYTYDLYAHPRLRKLEVPSDFDLASFHAFSDIWYVDKKHVYFQGYMDLQPAEMIDRDSAVLVNDFFIRDKNHVYSRSQDPSRGYRDLYFVEIEKDIDVETVKDLGQGDIADQYHEYCFECDED